MHNDHTQMVWVRPIYARQILYQLIQNIEVYCRDVPIFYRMCIQANFVKCDSFLNKQDKCGAYQIKKS